MCRFQSGPRLAAGSQFKPLQPLAATACAALLCTTLVALVAPSPAHAQMQAQVPQARQASDLRPDPLNAQAAIPPLVHESAFTQYRGLSDVPVGSWRDANDTVTRIGGWRVYAREATQPASPASSPAASVRAGSGSAPGFKPAEPAKAVPMPGGKDPHAGHKMN